MFSLKHKIPSPLKYSTIKALLISCALPLVGQAQSTIVDAHGQLHIEGTRIKDECGRNVQLRGMSYFWHQWDGSFRHWTSGTVRWLRDDWNVTVVRGAMGIHSTGYFQDKQFAEDTMRQLIDACIEHGIYVIVDWHSHGTYTEEAKAFFSDIARDYGDHPNIIYEIFNEPIDQSWGELKSYGEQVIAAIRQHDPDNIIIMGTPFYSQDVDEASYDPIQFDSNGNAVNNIAYTIHAYAGAHRQFLRDKGNIAINNGLCLFMTECGRVGTNYGPNNNTDAAEWDRWEAWMDTHGISWCRWSLSNKNEVSSHLQTSASVSGNWDYWNDLTTEGRWSRDRFRAINSIPEPCTTSNPDTGTGPGSELKLDAWNASSNSDVALYQGYGAASFDPGDSIYFPGVNLGSGFNQVTIGYATPLTGSFELRKGSADGELLASISIGSTGGWDSFSTVNATLNSTQASGTHTIFLVNSGEGSMNVRDITFKDPAPADDSIQLDAWNASSDNDVQFFDGYGVGYFEANESIYFDNVDLSTGYRVVNIEYTTVSDGNMEVRLGSPNGTLLATSAFNSTGDWNSFVKVAASLDPCDANGSQRVYLVNKGPGPVNVRGLTFSGKASEQVLVDSGATVTRNAWDGSSNHNVSFHTGYGIGGLDGGESVFFNNVDLSSGYMVAGIEYGTVQSGSFEVRLGSESGQLLATLQFNSTGDWSSWSPIEANIDSCDAKGNQTVYIINRGGSGSTNLRSIYFRERVIE